MTSYGLIIKFSDAETPLGGPAQFYLANAPVAESLQLFRNGMLLSAAAGDYILAGQVIVPQVPMAPEDRLVAFYRFL